MEKKKNSELLSAHDALLKCRKGFTVVLFFNFAFLIERTTFDFMGFMFGMIIADLLFLFFLITGLFGAYQYRVNYIVTLVLASVFWIAWNLFIICVYLNVGSLDRRNPNMLNLNTNKTSWWYSNNIGCIADYTTLLASYHNQQFKSLSAEISAPIGSNVEMVANTKDQLTLLRHLKSTNMPSMSPRVGEMDGVDPAEMFATTIENMSSHDEIIRQACFLPYYLIEIIQSGILIFFGVLCVIFGLLLSNVYKDESLTNEAMEAIDRVTIVTNANEPSSLGPQSRSETFKFDPCYIYGGAGVGGGTKF